MIRRAAVPSVSSTTTTTLAQELCGGASAAKSPRRHFSSARNHEHDKLREGWQDAGVLVDYWKAHKNDRLVLDDEAIDVIDYWEDHTGSHVAAESAAATTTSSGMTASHRNYSTARGETSLSNKTVPVQQEGGGPAIDYWSKHNDTHYTDYWEDQPESHVAESGTSSSFTATHRNFSTMSNEMHNSTAHDEQEGDGPSFDYWTRHNDTHYTDYWEEHDHTHT
jgi:hypothetical protein